MTDTIAVPDTLTFYDKESPLVQSALKARAGTDLLRQSLKEAIVFAEKKRCSKEDFSQNLKNLYWHDPDDLTKCLALVDSLATKSVIENWSPVSFNDVRQHISKFIHNFVIGGGSSCGTAELMRRHGFDDVMQPVDGFDPFPFDFPNLILHILQSSNIFVPVGSPAIGYGLRLDREVISRITTIFKEMVVYSGPTSLAPVVEWMEIEGFLMSDLLSQSETFRKENKVLTSKIDQLTKQLADLKAQASASSPYTWEV